MSHATKTFASQADLDDKHVTFSQISGYAWAYTAEGDPNTGIIIGDDAVLVADTQATPAMAQDVSMPFDVTRCYDEVTAHPDPRIWTTARDIEMWRTLEG